MLHIIYYGLPPLPPTSSVSAVGDQGSAIGGRPPVARVTAVFVFHGRVSWNRDLVTGDGRMLTPAMLAYLPYHTYHTYHACLTSAFSDLAVQVGQPMLNAQCSTINAQCSMLNA